MKKLSFFLLALLVYQFAHAQSVGIGTNNPNGSAILDLTSTTGGLLVPRMTAVQRRAISAPVSGLIVYQTNAEIFPPFSRGGFYIYSYGVWTTLLDSDDKYWTKSSSRNWVFNAIDSIGIGTTSPTSRFHIIGNALIENGNLILDDPFATIFLKNDNQNKGFLQLRSDDNVKLGTSPLSNTTGDLIFETQGIARMTIKPDGKVGIGYTNPTNKLDVHGSLRAAGNLTVEDGLIFLNNTENNKIWVIQQDNTSQGVNFLEAGNTRLMLKNGGNIGINTSNPSAKLHIEGGQDAGLGYDKNGYIKFGESSNENLIIDNNEIMAKNGYNSASTLYLQNQGGELVSGARLTINSDDEVLRLNGNNPVARFYLNGSSKGTIGLNGGGDMVLLTNSGSDMKMTPNGGSVFINPSSGGSIYLGPSGGGAISMNTGGGANISMSTLSGGHILMNPNGQVAIGVQVAAASEYKLTVSGKVLCEELKVKLRSAGWPDYVFEKKYQLPALAEVEKFIQQFKHLPNIPSAAEVEKNGIELGDMQKRMMEKIEELTLYAIQLQKEIDALKKEK